MDKSVRLLSHVLRNARPPITATTMLRLPATAALHPRARETFPLVSIGAPSGDQSSSLLLSGDCPDGAICKVNRTEVRHEPNQLRSRAEKAVCNFFTSSGCQRGDYQELEIHRMYSNNAGLRALSISAEISRKLLGERKVETKTELPNSKSGTAPNFITVPNLATVPNFVQV